MVPDRCRCAGEVCADADEFPAVLGEDGIFMFRTAPLANVGVFHLSFCYRERRPGLPADLVPDVSSAQVPIEVTGGPCNQLRVRRGPGRATDPLEVLPPQSHVDAMDGRENLANDVEGAIVTFELAQVRRRTPPLRPAHGPFASTRIDFLTRVPAPRARMSPQNAGNIRVVRADGTAGTPTTHVHFSSAVGGQDGHEGCGWEGRRGATCLCTSVGG